jgi:hypothetical protein
VTIDAIFSAMLADARREATGTACVGLRLIEDLEIGLRRDKTVSSSGGQDVPSDDPTTPSARSCSERMPN